MTRREELAVRVVIAAERIEHDDPTSDRGGYLREAAALLRKSCEWKQDECGSLRTSKPSAATAAAHCWQSKRRLPNEGNHTPMSKQVKAVWIVAPVGGGHATCSAWKAELWVSPFSGWMLAETRAVNTKTWAARDGARIFGAAGFQRYGDE